MNETVAALFEPFQIKNMRLRNRIVMAPMHTKFASESGEVTERLTSYLVERARGEVGLIILENTCIDWVYGRAAGNPVTIHDDLNRTGLSNLTLAVHRHGAKKSPSYTTRKAEPQVQHSGRYGAGRSFPGKVKDRGGRTEGSGRA